MGNFIKKLALILPIPGHHAPWHINVEENRQASIGNHQEEWQCHHRADIMKIQPGTLPLARAERKEISNNFFMGDNAAN